ncbi:MAG: hypothetical protein QW701_01605 [Candidatus Nezhaarchaeales archaeon]
MALTLKNKLVALLLPFIIIGVSASAVGAQGPSETVNAEPEADYSKAKALIEMSTSLYNRITSIIEGFNIALPIGLNNSLSKALQEVNEAQKLIEDGDYATAVLKALDAMNCLNPVLRFVLSQIRLDQNYINEARARANATLCLKILERIENIINATEDLNVTVPLKLKIRIRECVSLLREQHLNASKVRELTIQVEATVREFVTNVSRNMGEVSSSKVTDVIIPQKLKLMLTWLNQVRNETRYGVDIAISRINASVERLKEIRDYLISYTNASSKAVEAIDKAIEMHITVILRLKTLKEPSREDLDELIMEQTNRTLDVMSTIIKGRVSAKLGEELKNLDKQVEQIREQVREKLKEQVAEHSRTSQGGRVNP